MSQSRIPRCFIGAMRLLTGALLANLWFVCNGNKPAGPVETLYHLTVIAGAGGKITVPVQGSLALPEGAAAGVSARANPGFSFVRWVVLGDNATISYINSPDAVASLGSGNDTVRSEFIAVPPLPEHIEVSALPVENGVNILYYKGSWASLPDFSALKPDTAGPADTFSVATLLHGTDGFGAVLGGFLSIPLDGNYTFYLSCSGGSALYLNDSLVLSTTSLAAPAQDSVTIPLTQGTYLIGARYITASSAPILNLAYACPDNGIDRTAIPKDALQRCDTRPIAKITVTRPAGGETFRLGDTIHVQWTYKNPRGQTVAQISVDNGKSYSNITNNAFPGTASSYDWVIPTGADSFVSPGVVIRVKEYPPFDVRGISKEFSIVAR